MEQNQNNAVSDEQLQEAREQLNQFEDIPPQCEDPATEGDPEPIDLKDLILGSILKEQVRKVIYLLARHVESLKFKDNIPPGLKNDSPDFSTDHAEMGQELRKLADEIETEPEKFFAVSITAIKTDRNEKGVVDNVSITEIGAGTPIGIGTVQIANNFRWRGERKLAEKISLQLLSEEDNAEKEEKE